MKPRPVLFLSLFSTLFVQAPARAQFEPVPTTGQLCTDCPGDLNGDGKRNGLDIRQFITCYLGGSVPNGCECADVDNNGLLTTNDITQFVTILLSNPAQCCSVFLNQPDFIILNQPYTSIANLRPPTGTCTWTAAYTGTGRVTINVSNCTATITGTVASSSIGDVTINVSSTVNNGSGTVTCTGQKKLTVVQMETTNIKFDYLTTTDTDTGDGLNIRKSYAADLDHTGNGKGTGEWVKATRSEPALYVANKTVKCAVRFTVKPIGITSANIAAYATGTISMNVVSTPVSFDAGTGISNPEYTVMSFDSPTPSRISRQVGTFLWDALSINGSSSGGPGFSIFDESGAIPAAVPPIAGHLLYTVLNVPQTPWYDIEKQHPWAVSTATAPSALDFAIVNCGTDGLTTPEDAAKAITNHVFSGFGLKYDTVGGAAKYCRLAITKPGDATCMIEVPTIVAGMTKWVPGLGRPAPDFDLTKFIVKGNGATVNCYDCAAAVASLSNLVGANSAFNYMEPFGYILKTSLIGVGDCNNPFFKGGNLTAVGTNMPCVTDAVAMPCVSDKCFDDRSSFSNHGFVNLGGKIFDACAGPHIGAETPAQYVTNSIDSNAACEMAEAGAVANICTDVKKMTVK